ncbi:hypothetical protein NC652_025320 [Populus alba x Populus x berolinensis]|uniref:Uncharacterized protein n=2 Tax=Populus TaxID=3689 RepID=A0A4V6A8P0_POPAL|nr:hypothetical protein NC652_025320 [Populus alba x Populus x berolinensis]KAJ6981689.1 hypothetical protein NC653_024940 [Populus alba x Populus x berolinensis]TKS03696.1 hypothetical protein D5086_0000149990 [Populus alba]
MEMVKVVAVRHLLLLVLVFVSGTTNMSSVKAGDCRGGYLSTIGGGCPDKRQCLEICRPCYRGYGIIEAYCVGPGGPFPYWECRCAFKKGAPCPPPGPPQCPGRWPPPLTNSTTLNGTLV